MAMLRIVATGLLGALLVAGCASQLLPEAKVVVDGVPSGDCIVHPTHGPGPFLQCPTAVELAVEKLAVLPGTVSAVEFHRGVLCPPNARCRQSTDEGTVIFWFHGAPPVMVHIITEGPAGFVGFVAGEPQAPPEWFLDERDVVGMPVG